MKSNLSICSLMDYSMINFYLFYYKRKCLNEAYFLIINGTYMCRFLSFFSVNSSVSISELSIQFHWSIDQSLSNTELSCLLLYIQKPLFLNLKLFFFFFSKLFWLVHSVPLFLHIHFKIILSISTKTIKKSHAELSNGMV